MTQANKRIEPALLKRFVPICELTQENLHELSYKARIQSLPAGRALFKRGDSDNATCYLLSGEVILNDGKENRSFVGGSAAARYPLDHHRPRQATATAATEVQVLFIDNDLLDVLLAWDQSSTGYLVSEIHAAEETASNADDWMTHILRSTIFHRIPPANIQAIFMRMEAVRVQAGELVIHQGGEGDFYYYVREGRALVYRSSAKTGKEIKLAELNIGSSFGEEALVSGAKRNANVRMLTDGTLMRLGKKDFEALLKEPVLHWVSYAQAEEMVRNGAVWLDVRLESEYKNGAIPRSANLPLYLLRIKASALKPNLKYIVYCDTGRRSAAGTYLLNERGFDAYALEGGLVRLRQGSPAPA